MGNVYVLKTMGRFNIVNKSTIESDIPCYPPFYFKSYQYNENKQIQMYLYAVQVGMNQVYLPSRDLYANHKQMFALRIYAC